MANFGINGFGRIGRNVLRAMSQEQVAQVKAINDLTDTHTLAHLLKWDSVHGKFDGEIGYDEENIIVRGQKIKSSEGARSRQIAVEGSRRRRRPGIDRPFHQPRQSGAAHCKGGAKKVLISAPAKNPDATICLGHQRRDLRCREDEHHFQRELHDQLPRPAGQGAARQFHDRERFHEHDPQLHERPAHSRSAAQGFAARRARRRSASSRRAPARRKRSAKCFPR